MGYREKGEARMTAQHLLMADANSFRAYLPPSSLPPIPHWLLAVQISTGELPPPPTCAAGALGGRAPEACSRRRPGKGATPPPPIPPPHLQNKQTAVLHAGSLGSRFIAAAHQANQYAFAKMATSVAGAPLRKHVPLCDAGWSKGKHRSVADVSSFTCRSWSSLPAQGPRAHLPAARRLGGGGGGVGGERGTAWSPPPHRPGARRRCRHQAAQHLPALHPRTPTITNAAQPYQYAATATAAAVAAAAVAAAAAASRPAPLQPPPHLPPPRP